MSHIHIEEWVDKLEANFMYAAIGHHKEDEFLEAVKKYEEENSPDIFDNEMCHINKVMQEWLLIDENAGSANIVSPNTKGAIPFTMSNWF